MSRKYKFEFGEVEIYRNIINVASRENYKAIEKQYEADIKTLSRDIQGMLDRLFKKKRVIEEEINESQRLELEGFFNKLAGIENVEILIEEEPEPEPVQKDKGSKIDGKEMYKERGDIKSKYIVQVTENVQFNCEHDGSISNAEANGKLQVINNGSKDRIWDIDIELEGGKNAKIDKKEFHINNLDAGETWDKEYHVAVGENDKPCLIITEHINTTPDSDQEPCLFYIYNPDSRGEKTEFKITLENSGKSDLVDINLDKAVSSDFRDISSLSGADESFSRGDGKLKWHLDKMSPGDKKTIGFTATVTPNEIKDIPSGEINASYVLQDATQSGLKASFVDGLSSCIYYLDRDERDEEPDVWDIDFNFNNRSEFPMVLQHYDFHFGDEDTETKVIANDIDVHIQPGEKWESEKWELDSEDEPTCDEHVLYTVYASILEGLKSSIKIAPIQLPVVSIQGSKTYDKDTVESFRETPVGVTIEIAPKGPTPVQALIIEDTIPGKFKVSDEVEMEIHVGDKKVPLKDVVVSYEPGGEDISVDRKMKIEIKDLLDKYGELSPDTKVTLNYTMVAVNPEKDLTFMAPLTLKAQTYPSGSIVETLVEPAVISVSHKRRGTRVGKSISAKADHVYLITLLYKNKGDTTRQNVKISDFVPKEFELLESSMEHQTQKAKDGTIISWVIKEIAPGQEVEITHSIRGQGDVYSLKNIEVKVFN